MQHFFSSIFYRSIPDELLEAAKLDGANSWKFFIDFLVPLSKTMIAAMFIFMFVYGYNQYLWPLIMTTSEKYWTVVMGLKMIYGGNSVDRYTYVILSLLPPVNNYFFTKIIYTRIISNKMNSKTLQFTAHFILWLGVLIMVVPIWIAFASSTHEMSI